MLIWGFPFIGILYRFDELEEYLRLTEEYLMRARDDFKTRTDAQFAKLNAQQQEEFSEFYSENYWQLKERFPRILRNSFIVALCSITESEMRRIARFLQKESNLAISWGDLQGDVLDKLKKYWQLAGLGMLDDPLIWQDLKDLFMIRNCIVHNGGLIKGFSYESQLRTYDRKKGIISTDTIHEELALTEGHCKELIKSLRKLIEKLNKTYTEKRKV